MLKRTISGAILIAAMIGLMYAGGWVLLAGLLAMSLIGLYEFYRAVQNGGHHPFRILGAVCAFIYYAAILINPHYVREGGFLLLFITLALMAVMIVSVVYYPRRRIEDGALTIGGLIYVPMLFSFLYFLREQPDGIFYVWFVFLASWGSDTCAYLAGRAFGRHKLAPQLSPKKTVEGAVGGVVGAAALSLAYAACIQSFVQISASGLYLISVLVGLFGSVLGQMGDLFASSVKRVMQIKDYGRLIPGHGGILDRFDSTLLVGPAVMIVIYIAVQCGI